MNDSGRKCGGDDVTAGDGRLHVGLEHHGAAHRERRRDRAHREDQRRVPGRNDADDADRHAHGDALDLIRFLDDAALAGVLGQARGFAQLADGDAHFEIALGPDAARFADVEVGDFVMRRFEQIGGFAQDLGALGGRCRHPARKRGFGALGGFGDVALVGDAGAADRLPG